MKEIKLIVSQEKLEENRRNTLLKDETRRNNKKLIVIRNISTYIVLILILFLTFTWLLNINFGLKQKGIKGCIENGYSETYCIQHS